MNHTAPPADLVACSLLFVGGEGADEADTAAREAALELAGSLARPVLLLDAGMRADGCWTQFAATGRLRPRPAWSARPGQPALHFHPVAGPGRLFVSTLSHAGLAADDGFWRREAEHWPGTQRRLLELFAAVVLAGPPLSVSVRMLDFAMAVDAAVLVVRSGPRAAAAAERLRRRVLEAGGRAAGVVLTGCADPLDDVSDGGRRW